MNTVDWFWRLGVDWSSGGVRMVIPVVPGMDWVLGVAAMFTVFMLLRVVRSLL